jgi:hypothetical protein
VIAVDWVAVLGNKYNALVYKQRHRCLWCHILVLRVARLANKVARRGLEDNLYSVEELVEFVKLSG